MARVKCHACAGPHACGLMQAYCARGGFMRAQSRACMSACGAPPGDGFASVGQDQASAWSLRHQIWKGRPHCQLDGIVGVIQTPQFASHVQLLWWCLEPGCGTPMDNMAVHGLKGAPEGVEVVRLLLMQPSLGPQSLLSSPQRFRRPCARACRVQYCMHTPPATTSAGSD